MIDPQIVDVLMTARSRAVEKHVNSIFSKLGLPAESRDASRREKAALLFLAEEQAGRAG